MKENEKIESYQRIQEQLNKGIERDDLKIAPS
jgi:hypothetical protein